MNTCYYEHLLLWTHFIPCLCFLSVSYFTDVCFYTMMGALISSFLVGIVYDGQKAIFKSKEYFTHFWLHVYCLFFYFFITASRSVFVTFTICCLYCENVSLLYSSFIQTNVVTQQMTKRSKICTISVQKPVILNHIHENMSALVYNWDNTKKKILFLSILLQYFVCVL